MQYLHVMAMSNTVTQQVFVSFDKDTFTLKKKIVVYMLTLPFYSTENSLN